MSRLARHALSSAPRSYATLLSQIRGLCSNRILKRQGSHAIDSVSCEGEEEEEGVFVHKSVRSSSSSSIRSSSLLSPSPSSSSSSSLSSSSSTRSSSSLSPSSGKSSTDSNGDEGLEIAKLPIAPSLLQNLARRGIEKLFPIQVGSLLSSEVIIRILIWNLLTLLGYFYLILITSNGH